MARGRKLAEETDVVRVLINQAHTFGNGGGFDNGLNFTLSMGCGTWGGNSITDNLNYRHFINITHLVTTIPEDRAERGRAVRRVLEEIREVGTRRGRPRARRGPSTPQPIERAQSTGSRVSLRSPGMTKNCQLV